MTRRDLITRRLFLQGSLLMVAGACTAPSAPAPTSAPAKPTEAAKPAAPAATTAPAAPAAQPASTTAPPTAAAAAKPTEAAKPAGAAPAVARDSAAWQTILDAAKKEGKVLMYGTLLGSDDVTKVAAAFKEQTGIDFDFITIQGGPATTRTREEIKANKAPDIFEASGGWVGNFAPEGVFTPLKDKPLPVWSEP